MPACTEHTNTVQFPRAGGDGRGQVHGGERSARALPDTRPLHSPSCSGHDGPRARSSSRRGTSSKFICYRISEGSDRITLYCGFKWS
jgi:hypothetical protein